jgi:hypothetical protein
MPTFQNLPAPNELAKQENGGPEPSNSSPRGEEEALLRSGMNLQSQNPEPVGRSQGLEAEDLSWMWAPFASGRSQRRGALPGGTSALLMSQAGI